MAPVTVAVVLELVTKCLNSVFNKKTGKNPSRNLSNVFTKILAQVGTSSKKLFDKNIVKAVTTGVNTSIEQL